MKKASRWLLFFAALGLIGLYLVYQVFLAANVRLDDGETREFLVPTGADYVTVAEKLRSEGIINDAQTFHWVAEALKYPQLVKPGRYLIDDGLSAYQLVRKLRAGEQSPVDFTFVKFRTKEQLATYAAEKLEFSEADLLAVLNDREFLAKKNGLSPETAITVFIPNTYQMWWNTSAKAFFERMYDEYKRFWNDTRNAQRKKLKLNRLDVMTLASIVEEETNKNDEKQRIAGVYLNRIRKKWPLEADPTVKYAVGDFSIKRVLNKHLQVDSPYNTYLYPGIPPGPICTPSISSIDAVLNSERHTYMFFCASVEMDGSHHFSETLAAHNAYARAYHQKLNQVGIR